MMLCDGDAVEFDKLIHSPISLYEVKLRAMIEQTRPKEKKNTSPVKKPI